MSMEKELRRALSRVNPPADFAQRVIALAGAAARPRKRWWNVRLLVLANAFGLSAALLIAGVAWERYQQQHAFEARRQLVVALDVTRTSLQKTQERIRRVAAKPVI